MNAKDQPGLYYLFTVHNEINHTISVFQVGETLSQRKTVYF